MQIKTIPVGMLHTNCYLLIDSQSKECAVIDPGANSGRILEKIREIGVRPTHIILTHGHFDHVLAAPEVQRQTGARLLIHQRDAHMLSPSIARHPGYIREDYTQPRVDGFLEDGMAFKVGGLQCKALSTPGHTKGSCVILCGDVMFSGDTLFAGDCGRTDLEGGDMDEMMESLGRLYRLEGDYKVLPGHEEATTLGEQRQVNPYMRRGAGV